MNCNLELELGVINPNSHKETQQLTMFYNGRIFSCDVTEIQARAILWQASRQMDNERCNRRSDPIASNLALAREPISTSSSSSSGLSMKKSLQSFLQKRKNRQLAISPYSTANRID